MTAASLGLRSGSNGSLHQQLQNGAFSATQPIFLRRASRSVSGRIYKFVGRRKVGILLMLMISVTVLSFVSIISRDEDSLVGATTLMYSENLSMKSSKSPFIVPHEESSVRHNTSLISLPSHRTTPHPCERFPVSSPPMDKRHTGPRPCPVCYIPVEQALLHMPYSTSPSPVLKNLHYFSEDSLISYQPKGGSNFGGLPSLLHRNESFTIRESMTVHCGFANGRKPGRGTGFDIDGDILLEMEECHDVVVASAIFGNYDLMQQPQNISEYTKKNVCFYMFVDEKTEAYMRNSSGLDDSGKVGLWRVVVVQNLPYEDSRRNGKIPKLLLHRLFPNARFSIWIDGKLQLVVDPYQILERFLWRKNQTFAISRHYSRFDVFEEAEANKAAGKYDNASIDHQIEFYKKEGLTPYSLSKLPITSDVPEGCVIIREHMPITNLFTCLWFNEVDRFTARDQISFSTVRDKITSQVDWTINMFMDCERRNFVVQAYHRDLLEQRKALAAMRHPPPAAAVTTRDKIARVPPLKKLPGKTPSRRGRDKRSGSRRRHPRVITGRL
ncbi:putative hexosyltransferase MUCI70 isoform X1 [Curcuma longa]|uniref:putative hexosyltransferase MUCI70 isoform X1 n=2 Tax=Curcuma longa TaxID=136217 RepID=UPI003D9E7D48